MAKSKREITRTRNEVRKETWQAVLAIVFFVLSLLSILAAFGKAGMVGTYLFLILKKLLGIGYFLLPIALIMVGISFLKGVSRKFEVSKFVGVILFFLSGLGLLDLLVVHEGGILGRYISSPLISLFDVYAAAILLASILTISILITFDIHFTFENLMFWKYFMKKKDGIEDEEDSDVEIEEGEGMKKALERIEKEQAEMEETEDEEKR